MATCTQLAGKCNNKGMQYKGKIFEINFLFAGASTPETMNALALDEPDGDWDVDFLFC